MPKYGIHQIVLARAADQFIADPVTSTAAAGNDINTHRGAAMLGAVGPDLFFWAPDYKVVDKLYTLHKNIGKLVDIYNDVTRPVREIGEAVGEAAEEAVSTLTPNTVDPIKTLLERIKQTSQLFDSTLRTGLFAGVISVSDFFSDLASLPNLSATLFDTFAPPLQNQVQNGVVPSEKTWYWFDMLHYRRTGEFASQMISSAKRGSPVQRAYALGYLSHIATDVLGHPYVNQIVGGPYRLNVQRHVAVENYMDCWAFNRHYTGASVSKTVKSKLGVPLPSDLPDEIVDLLDSSFRATYPDIAPTLLGSPGFLSKNQIRDTYTIFYDVLNLMEKMVVDRPTEPFSGVLDILSRALDDLLESPPSPPSPPSGGTCGWEDILSFGLTSSSRDCYEEFFDQLGDWVEYMGELILWSLETMQDLLDLILATLLAMPISTLLALLYGLQLLLYGVYQLMRRILAEHGFVYPEPEDLLTSTATSLVTTVMSCSPAFKYPVNKKNDRSHLVCPIAGLESPTTAADFQAFSGNVTPSSFMEETIFSESVLAEYAKSPSPADTRKLEREKKRIGNALDLTMWMVKKAMDPSASSSELATAFTNWNLDSDRGYGYKTWNGTLAGTPAIITPEDYV